MNSSTMLLQHPPPANAVALSTSPSRGEVFARKRARSGVCSPQSADEGGCFDHAVGEAPFIVVPRKDAAKAPVDDVRLRQIESRAVRVMIEIGRDAQILVDSEDAAEAIGFRSLLHDLVDLALVGVARRREFEIDER